MFQYYVIKDGEQRTTYVSIANTFFSSILSFISEKPALENVKSLEKGSISMINKKNLKMLINKIPSFKNFYISLLKASMCSIDASRHDLIVIDSRTTISKNA